MLSESNKLKLILGSDTDDSLSVLSSNFNVNNSSSPNIDAYNPFDDTSSEILYSNSSNNN